MVKERRIGGKATGEQKNDEDQTLCPGCNDFSTGDLRIDFGRAAGF
jgi:hypothetical protein